LGFAIGSSSDSQCLPGEEAGFLDHDQKILNEAGLGSRVDRWLALEAANAEKAIEITPEQAFAPLT